MPDFSAEVGVGVDGEVFVGCCVDFSPFCSYGDIYGASSFVVEAYRFNGSDFFFGDAFGVEVDTDFGGEPVGGLFEGDDFGSEDVWFFSSEVESAFNEDDFVGCEEVGVLPERVWEEDDFCLPLEVFECADGHFSAGVSAGLCEVVSYLGNHTSNDDLFVFSEVSELRGIGG